MNEQSRLAIKAIDDMRSSGSLDDSTYYKFMMEMAYDFYKKDDIDGCVFSVGRCPPDYYVDEFAKQMDEDSVFKDKMVYLSYKFVIMNMVDVGYDVPTNQKGLGRA